MFGLFERGSGEGGVTPSLDAVGFDTTEYQSGDEPRPGQVRVWFTSDGDRLGLYLFTVPPDLPPARTADELRTFYARSLEASGGRLVETAGLTVGGCAAVRIIFKTPQQPSGMTYVGSVTIPFRDFSFVVKVQCEERGTTGLREAVLLDRLLQAGSVPSVSGGRTKLPVREPDSEEFDAEFPGHPVSRVRKVLRRVCGSLVVKPGVAGSPGFPLPRDLADAG